MSSSDFWSVCLSRFEQELSQQQFQTWIKTLRTEDAANDPDREGRVRLIAPNRFVLQWVRERYLRRIEELSQEFFDSPVSIMLSLPETNTPTAPPVGPGDLGLCLHQWSVAATRSSQRCRLPRKQAPTKRPD